MTREEAIDILFGCIEAHSEEENEALDMAIEALQTPPISQRSMYQAGYRQGREEALKREPSEDGTLEIKVEDATKGGRVLISDDKHRGGLYYPDEDEPKGDDLISRQDAIEHFIRLSEDESLTPYTQMLMIGVSNEIKKLPSTDRPKGEWIPCEERLPSEKKAVLICDSHGNRFVGRLILTDYGYKWGIPLFRAWVDIEDGDVWMPLPKPYGERSEE